MKIVLAFAFAMLASMSWAITPAFAQTDAEYFSEGRIALDNYKDCKAASSALNKVSAAVQQDPVWIFYMARAYECLEEYTKALDMYRRYNETVPGQPEVITKIGEIRYKIGKAEERKAEEQRHTAEEEQRQNAEKRRAQTIFTGGSVDPDLIATLVEIASTGLSLRTAAMFPDGSWIVGYSPETYWASKQLTYSANLRLDLRKSIETWYSPNKKRWELENIWATASGEWMATSRKEVRASQGVPRELLGLKNVDEAAIFPNGEWMASVFEIDEGKFRNYSSAGIPTELHSQLRKFENSGTRDMVTTSREGWLLVGIDGSFYSMGMPSDLMNEMSRLVDENRLVYRVLVNASGGWVIICYFIP